MSPVSFVIGREGAGSLKAIIKSECDQQPLDDLMYPWNRIALAAMVYGE